MREDAVNIIASAIKASDPYFNTKNILSSLFSGDEKIHVMSIGKAAVPMARAALEVLDISSGLLVTKYRHSEGFSSDRFEIIEAGHPISDENSRLAAKKGLDTAKSLGENDTLLVLLSGGGSALFEESIVSPEMQREITETLLASGADIEEINAVRRRLSLVKGGRLAAAAYPARVITVALSDVLSNDKSTIASGITVKDTADNEYLSFCVEKYLPWLSSDIKEIIFRNDDIKINDGGYYFAGDINILCNAAEKKAESLGYTVHSMERSLSGEASSEAKRLISSVPHLKGRHCFVFGGETVVTLKGKGKGGRNQEMALSAAVTLRDKKNIAFMSAGSDGTDGPTDAAGGYADGESYTRMCKMGISPEAELENNNSYHALKTAELLYVTGPTGTNVNDITVILTCYED